MLFSLRTAPPTLPDFLLRKGGNLEQVSCLRHGRQICKCIMYVELLWTLLYVSKV